MAQGKRFTGAGRVPMIARAMKTRPDSAVAYRELARRGAAISRQLNPAALPRWSQAVQRGGPVATQLAFSLDADGNAWARGGFVAEATLRCKRCAEVLDTQYSGSVEVCLVADEHAAQKLGAVCDVVVAPDAEVAIAEIVEDELLLEVPECLCESEPCERLPLLTYPSDAAEQIEEGPAAAESPFAVLGKLKTNAIEN